VDDATGLVTVFLDGISWQNCSGLSHGCPGPGRAVCFHNVSYLSAPRMCACLAYWDNEGSRCEAIGAVGWISFGVFALCSVIFICIILLAIKDILTLLNGQSNRMRLRWRSIIMSVQSLAFVAYVAGLLSCVANSVLFFVEPYGVIFSSRARDLSQVAPGVSLMALTPAFLILCFLWIRVTRQETKILLFDRFTKLFERSLFVSGWSLAIAFLITLTNNDYIAAIWIIYVAILLNIVPFVAVNIRVKGILRQLRQQNITAGRSVNEQLKKIMMITQNLSICLFVELVSLAVFLGFGGRDVGVGPYSRIPLLSYAINWTFVTLGHCILQVYLHSLVLKSSAADQSSNTAVDRNVGNSMHGNMVGMTSTTKRLDQRLHMAVAPSSVYLGNLNSVSPVVGVDGEVSMPTASNPPVPTFATARKLIVGHDTLVAKLVPGETKQLTAMNWAGSVASTVGRSNIVFVGLTIVVMDTLVLTMEPVAVEGWAAAALILCVGLFCLLGISLFSLKACSLVLRSPATWTRVTLLVASPRQCG
jgi:hypothetical protein